MIQVGTNVPVIDKSGAKQALCVCVLKGLELANVGDRIVVVVKKAVKKNTKKKLAQKSKLYQALVVKRKVIQKKESGLGVNFKKKGVIILKKNENEAFSIRLHGPVSIVLRKKGFTKILSMSSFVI